MKAADLSFTNGHQGAPEADKSAVATINRALQGLPILVGKFHYADLHGRGNR